MKKILNTISIIIIASIIPFTMAAGQEKKSQKKVKIIIEDNSGTKVIVDTLLNDISAKDSLKLKDGNVIYINDNGDELNIAPHAKSEKIFVKVSSDGRDEKKEKNEMKEYTVVYSDSAEAVNEGGHTKIYFSDDRKGGDNEANVRYKVITKSSKEDGDKDEEFYISDRKRSERDRERKFDVYVDNENESTGDKTRYVIAKDGIVVTVEGTDEVKTKELVKDIENKLGVKGTERKNKPTYKVRSDKDRDKE